MRSRLSSHTLTIALKVLGSVLLNVSAYKATHLSPQRALVLAQEIQSQRYRQGISLSPYSVKILHC